MTTLWRLLVAGLCIALGTAAANAMLHLPPPAVRLAAEVNAELGGSGVTQAVTAVLLNFRGYDTLLEIAVLLAALFGVLDAAGGRADRRYLAGAPQALLQSTARLLRPLVVLVAGYLLWAGTYRAGGAFQAGAVLAAGAVLLYLSGLLPALGKPGAALRAGMVGGFLVFLAVAALALARASLLQYPTQHAGALIFLIEAALTPSLGLMLAGLFLGLPSEYEEAQA